MLLAIGLVVGIAGAFVAAGVIQKLLFGVPPHDPTTFIGVVVMMAAIGIIACWIPAVRAARIDPAITMRSSWRDPLPCCHRSERQFPPPR